LFNAKILVVWRKIYTFAPPKPRNRSLKIKNINNYE